MFLRAIKKLPSFSNKPTLFQQSKKYCAQNHITEDIKANTHDLIKVGDNFKDKGHILQAGRVYKAAIDILPTDKTAYDKLWECFTIRGLMVTKEELNWFDERYRMYIQPQEVNTFKPNRP